MEDLLSSVQQHPALYVLAFALLFRAVHWILRTIPLPKPVEQEAFRAFKWHNLSVSMVHSLITSTWSVSCAVLWPDLLYQIYSYYTPVCYLLVCVSTGYFLQDAYDIIFSGYAMGSWEFLLHHVLVLWCFLYALFTKHYIGGSVIALFVEVNSIFLHARMMLKLAKAQSSPLYTINKLVNIFTYAIFRLGPQGYLTWYIIHNYSWLDHAGYLLVALVLMNIMMTIYFYRLLRADFLPNLNRQPSQNNSNKFLKE
ncbi:hypothetical protein GJAV_G00139530 [Gymnothorax javanicus]|nr:hypothetical protein GJAV_G00139530 [Gymnothorax javanicus]